MNPRDGSLDLVGALVKIADLSVVVDVFGGGFYARIGLLDEEFQTFGIGYGAVGLFDGLGFILFLVLFSVVVRFLPFPLVLGNGDRRLLE